MNSKDLTRLLVGGGVLPKNMPVDNSTNILFVILIFFIVLALKGLLVMYTYNWIAPKLIYNVRNQYNINDFRPLTFWESIIVVILFNNLFCR